MSKGVNIPLTISGLREARENLEKLNDEFEKVKNDPIQSKKIAKEFNELSNAIDKTTDELLAMNNAGQLVGTKFDDLNEVLFQTQEEVLPLSSQIGEMEDRLYQLAKAGDTSSAEFKALQAEIVKNRKTIIETDRAIDSMVDNAGSLGGITTAFTELGDSVLSLDFKRAGTALKGLGTQFKAFGATLLANPIFLIVAVIAAVVTAVVTLKDKVKFLGAIFDFFAGIVNEAIQALKNFLDWIGLTNFAEQDLAAERKARAEENLKNIEKNSAEEQSAFDRKIALLNAEGKSTVELEIAKQKAIIETSKARAKEIIEIIRAEQVTGELTKERLEELGKLGFEQVEAIKDAGNQIKVIEATAYKERSEKHKEFVQNKLETSRLIQDLEIELMKEGTEKELAEVNLKYDRLIEDTKKNEKMLQSEKEKIVKYYESLRALEEGKILAAEKQTEKEKQEATAKFLMDANEAQMQLIEGFQEEAYQLLLTDQEREEEALRTKYEEQLNLARQYGQDTLSIEEAYAKEKADMEDRFRKEKLEKDQALEDAKLDVANQALGGLGQLLDGYAAQNEKNARKAFDIQKAVSIAQAVIDTYKGANAIFAAASANPSSILFPAQPFIMAGAAIAAGIGNVAKIQAMQFKSSSSGGGSKPSAPSLGGGGATSSSSSTPSFELFGQANEGNNVSAPQSQETTQMTVKAVVVESDITSTQNKINKIQKSAEL